MVKGQILRSVYYGITMAVLIVIFSLTPFAHHIEHRFGLGLNFGLRRPVAPPQGAMIVAIDINTITWLREISAKPPDGASHFLSCLPDRTIRELGRLRGPSALPRPFYACLLNELKHLGFAVVAFDVLFSVSGIEEDDMMLARAIHNHGATVILVGFEKYTIEESGSELRVQRVIQPLSLFKESAAATGSFLVPRSSGPVYGYRRRIAEFQETRTLPEEALYLYRRIKTDTNITAQQEPNFAYLWLYGPPKSIETISIRDLLRGIIPEKVRVSAANTAVFIGASDPTRSYYKDSYPSMYFGKSGAYISGVELAATAYLNMLSGDNLHRLPKLIEALITGLFAFTLGFLARALNRYILLAIAGLATAYLIVAVTSFFQYQLFLPVITVVFIASPLAFFVAVLVRSRIAYALIMRLAPAPIAKRMLTGSAINRAEVVSTEATVIFFDLIKSTTIGGTLTELEFSTLINDYLDTVTRAVEKHRGFVIAFTGDGATAVFDSTTAGSDHPLLACQSVVSTIREIRKLNSENGKYRNEPLGQRIGINSGRIAAGGIGSQSRFNFSVVGDAVNLASRLEQLGKTLFPDEKDVILVGSATRKMVKEQELSFVDCGLHSIPGRKTDENVFRLLVD